MGNFIHPEIKRDPSLSEWPIEALPLIQALREQHFSAPTEVCIERADLMTRYFKGHDNPNEDFALTRAKAIRHYLGNRKALFHDNNPLAGGTTSKMVGAPLYPEFMGLSIWPELETISTRKQNPQILSKADADTCNFDIFPYWMDNTALEKVRSKYHNPKSLQLMEKLVFYINGKAGCISHCVPGYEQALSRGLKAIIADAEEKASIGGSHASFFKAIALALQGILRYAGNLAKAARELAVTESNPDIKANYLQMADVCEQVPGKPARTFKEAVNSLWLCQVGIHAENINMAMSPGRLDQVLYPYFEKDVKENNISIENALNIGCGLWLKIADNTNLVPETAERLWGGAGSTPAVTLGGIDSEGKDAVNDLTYLFLKVTELMRLRDPSVNARYHYDINSKPYRQRVCEVIFNTRAIPAFHNDVSDIKTLINQGETEAHARDYAIVGCVELASTGRDYCSSSSIMFNLSNAIELALFNGKKMTMDAMQVGPQTGNAADFKDFDGFWEAFKKQLHFLIDNAVELNENFGYIHQEMLPTPLLSAFFEGPLENGKDLIQGGAPYNSSGASHVAYPDVVDSLNAIEKAVFIDKKCTLKELADAILDNFEGEEKEKLRLHLKNKTPKFGTDHHIARKNSANLVRTIYDIYQSYTTYRKGRYRPAYWTMTTHAGQGRLAGALPNGRKAGDVFSSGITPASQAAPQLSEALNAVAELPVEAIPGGEALNIKYTPLASQENKEQYLEQFGSLVEGYFRNGGLQVQFNLQTYDTLIDAKKHPEKYPEMIVRVSGYSAYYKDLSDAMKDELISRTQYNLMGGQAVSLPDGYKGGPA